MRRAYRWFDASRGLRWSRRRQGVELNLLSLTEKESDTTKSIG